MTVTRLRRYPALVLTATVALAAGVLLLTGQGDVAGTVAAVFAVVMAAARTVRMMRELARGRWGIDVLAVTAIVATVAVGEYGAALIIVVMMTGGEALETYAAGRASQELADLLARAPHTAHRHRGPGIEDVPVDEVRVGDLLLVRPAEVVPVDGVLQSPAAVFDESSLTGESLPVERRAGQAVLSGAVNGHEAVTIRAGATAADSQYSQIVALVREASASKAPVVRLADRYAVPFTVLAYLVAGLGWAVSGAASRFAQVLVVATPCPLLIAAPVAFLAGMSRAARRGIIVKGGAVLETLSRVRTVAFDKTGTLTHGRPELVCIRAATGWDELRLLELAASAEQYSSHVLAVSVIQAARDRGLLLHPADRAGEQATNGVAAQLAGQLVSVGKRAFVAATIGADRASAAAPAATTDAVTSTAATSTPAPPTATLDAVPEVALQEGELAVYVGVDAAYAGALVFSDPLRDNAAATLRRLRGLGVTDTMLLTGDAPATAAHVGAALGITDVRALLLPADKVAAVNGATKHPVLMVGDGVNDAPVLAAADVGVAMGARGATAASESADVVILRDDLSRVAEAVAIGRQTMRVAAASIWLGIALSAGLMAFAAFGFVPAIAGALAQEAVDLASIGCALLALREGGDPDRT